MTENKKYFIITGTSRGLGAAFAESLLDKEHVLFLISRNPNQDIRKQALMRNCQVHYIFFDLAETEKIADLMRNLFDHIPEDNCDSIYLLNNAGMTEPVKPIDKVEEVDIDTIINVNFKAPVLLVSNFIRLSEKYQVSKQILNITSGAASIPHSGLSMYCSTKAALDMFTMSVALEQDERDFPVEIHAISPGFVDTQMPNSLVEKDKSEFGSAEKFAEFQKEGKFADPSRVATKILRLWFSDQLKHGEISHIDDY